MSIVMGPIGITTLGTLIVMPGHTADQTEWSLTLPVLDGATTTLALPVSQEAVITWETTTGLLHLRLIASESLAVFLNIPEGLKLSAISRYLVLNPLEAGQNPTVMVDDLAAYLKEIMDTAPSSGLGYTLLFQSIQNSDGNLIPPGTTIQ